MTVREAPVTLLFFDPPDGRAGWHVTNPDITFQVSNPISPDLQYRTLFRFDGEGEETEWDGAPIKIPSDGQHVLEYRSVVIISDDFPVIPGTGLVSVPRYFSELPRKVLFKLDTTQPQVRTALTDLFDSRILITDDFFVNDGSAILTSVMRGKTTGSAFLRSDEAVVPPEGATVVDPDSDGKYVLQIDAVQLIPGTLALKTAARTLEEHADYIADYFEADSKVFAERLGPWPLDTEVFWEIDVRSVVRYENRDGRQRFIVRFPSRIESFETTMPDEGGLVDTNLIVEDVASTTADVSLTDSDGQVFFPGAAFGLVSEDGRVLLQNNSAASLPPQSVARLRLRRIENKANIERVNFVDDGTAFMLDEGTGIARMSPKFSLEFDARTQLLSVNRQDVSIPHDSDLVLEVKLVERSETSKFIDFGTYNKPEATRQFVIGKEQSVWYYARSVCPSTEESVANIVVSEIESGINKIFFTFNGDDPVEDEGEFIEAPAAVLPAPPSFRNRFVFKWLAVDRSGNQSTGFTTNVGEALTAPLVIPDSFLTKPVARIHFAPAGETLDESSPSIEESGEFIVVEKGVCQGCADINFLIVFDDGSRTTGSTMVCVVNEFVVGSFVPQIISEFGLGQPDSKGREWFRGFRPIVVLPIFGPRPTGLDSSVPFPSKIFFKWSDEDVFVEYTQPFAFKDIGENQLQLYVSFLDGNNNGTESSALRFTFFWDNERSKVDDNTEPKWVNRDAIVFFTIEETGSGVKSVLFRTWREVLETPFGTTDDAQGLVNLNDVVDFFTSRDTEAFSTLQTQDLTDEQINEYLRLANLPPVESMDTWALAGGVEDPSVRVEDQTTVDGDVFTEINKRISRLQVLDLESAPFIRFTDPGRYHVAVFVIDNANNVSADDIGISTSELVPVFTNNVVQIDQTPPLVSLAFDKPTTTTTLPDGSLLIELDAYPEIDIIATDNESGVSAAFFRFGGRNRTQSEIVLPVDPLFCDPQREDLPNTGEFTRFGGSIRLDASGPEFEDDIFFFATDQAGNRSSTFKVVIRVQLAGEGADTTPPTVRDIVPKNGKIDVSRNAHIQFFVQDDSSGVDIDSVVAAVNGVEFRLQSRPVIQLRFVPPSDRRDIEFLLATVVNNNLIIQDNFGIHMFLDGTVPREARISFDDDRFDTFREVVDFLNRIPGMLASLSNTSLETLSSALLRNVKDVQIFSRGDPQANELKPLTLLSLSEEQPQFAFFQRSKGFVCDINPRALFDSQGEVDVSIDARDLVGNEMDTLRMTFTAQEIRTRTAEERNDIFRRSQRFFDRMQDNTASIYRKNPFTNQSGFFKSYAHEYALMEREAVRTASEARFDTVSAENLFRNFGAIMDVIGTEFISHQRYRELLRDVRDGYLEGSNPTSMRATLPAWAPGGVEIIDFVDISDDIGDQHKIRIIVFYDDNIRRHFVTHPDPFKSGFDRFVRDFRPAHLSFGLTFAFGEQFEFQAGCEPVCVTQEGFRATRLLIEPLRVVTTVSAVPTDDDIERLRSLGFEVCRVESTSSKRDEIALCPSDIVNVRTKVFGFAQSDRIDAIESDVIVSELEVLPLLSGRCPCCDSCDGCDCQGTPEELARQVCCTSDSTQRIVWGPIESIDFFQREYTTNLGRIRVFVEEGRFSVARRTRRTLDGCDSIPAFECVDFDDLRVGDCVVAMGSFEGRTPVFKDGPWFNIWLTPEAYAIIRACDPSLPEEISVFDAEGNIVGGYVGIDSNTGLARVPPYSDYQRFLVLSADLARPPSQRVHLVPGHTAFREIVATLESCPEGGCPLLIKNRPTAICDCLVVTLQFIECDNLRKTSDEVESIAKSWREDVSEQWDGSGVYVVKGRPMLSPSRFVGDLRLAEQAYEVLAYVDCELADVEAFDPLRGTICLSDVPQQDQRVVIQYRGNEHVSVRSDRYHFTVKEDGSMELLDRSVLDGSDTPLVKEHLARDACEPLDTVNERNSDFVVESCLVQPNQQQPPELCLDAEPFAVRIFNDTRIEPQKLNRNFFLNAFAGLQKVNPLHAPVIDDRFPVSCLEFQEIRIWQSFNDTKSATNDPGTRKQDVDFLAGAKLPNRNIDFTEVCLCGQYYYDGAFFNLYDSELKEARDRRRKCFGFVEHDTRIIHHAVEEAVIPAPNFLCYGYEPDAYGLVYSPYYRYFNCFEQLVSGDGSTTSGGCPTIFERNPWVKALFDVEDELFWAVDGSDEPFPVGAPMGG